MLPPVFEELQEDHRPVIRPFGVVPQFIPSPGCDNKQGWYVYHAPGNATAYEIYVMPRLDVGMSRVAQFAQGEYMVVVPTLGLQFWLSDPEATLLDAEYQSRDKWKQVGIVDASEIIRVLVGITGCKGRIFTDQTGHYAGEAGREIG